MIDYLPFSPVFRLSLPDFDEEAMVMRVIEDEKAWVIPDFSFSNYRLQKFGVTDEWQYNPPRSHHAFNLVYSNVIVSSECGIIRTQQGKIIADSFDHAQPVVDLYRVNAANEISIPTPLEQLPGCWLSLLFSNQDNYYHCLVMNIGRLFQINANEARVIQGILVPEHLTDVEQRALAVGLKLVFGSRQIEIKKISWGISVEVEKIFYPWNAVCVFTGNTHSNVISFFRKMAGLLQSAGVVFPTRFYIDRRAASNRVLRNEDELIEILEAQGFAIIQLEYLSFDEQVLLFSNAEYIIGAHGAGLANTVFCQSGTRIIELIPHTLLRWCYRQIAMVADLSYQCVMTQSHSETEGKPPAWASHTLLISDMLDALSD